MENILVIESNPAVAKDILEALNTSGLKAVSVSNGVDGLQTMQKQRFDLMLIAKQLPDTDGISLIRQAHKHMIETPVIIVSSKMPEEEFVKTLWDGAFDCLIHPFDLNMVLFKVARALRLTALRVENDSLRKQILRRYDIPMMAGNSTVVRELFRNIEKISLSESSALMIGQRGSGRRTIASTIHQNSSRRRLRFVSVNCDVVPESLLEPMLFGMESGTHSYSIDIKPGAIEKANSGTLFLEDIDKLHLTLQDKLLESLRSGEFTRVGGMKPIGFSLRVLASASKDLSSDIEKGLFNKELYELIAQFRIELPPLRKRKDDIPVMLENFLREASLRLGHPHPKIGKEALNLMLKYDWPGNITELDDVANRLALLVPDSIVLPEHLPSFIRVIDESHDSSVLPSELEFSSIKLPEGGVNLKALTSELESVLIEQALDRTSWVKSKAAKLLGMNRTTLLEKLKRKF